MPTLATSTEVQGPWSLTTSRHFWEGFGPAALPSGDAAPEALRTVFVAEADWSRVEAEVTQDGSSAQVSVSGDGDLEAAATQVARFLALDVDARGWPGGRCSRSGCGSRRPPSCGRGSSSGTATAAPSPPPPYSRTWTSTSPDARPSTSAP